MDARAEQLVLDYLRRLEDAAQDRLGPAERVAFMARSRAAVARQIGETRADEADDVQRLLRRFGDPDRLAGRERQRLDRLGQRASGAQDNTAHDGMAHDDRGQDSFGHDGQGHDSFGHDGQGHDSFGHDGSGQSSAAAGRNPQDGPRQDGSRQDGSRQDGPRQDGPRQDGPRQDGSRQDGPRQDGSRQDGPRRTGSLSAAAEAPPGTVVGSPGADEVPGSARPGNPAIPVASRRPRGRPAAAAGPGRQPGAAPALHRPMTARWRPGHGTALDRTADPAPGLPLGSRWPRPVARPAPAGAPGSVAVPGSGRDDEQAPAGGGWDPGAGEPDTAGPGWLAGLLAVIRKHPLECVAILLIGLGGLIDPWPLWPVGALAMFASPLWGVRDKLATVVIPLGFALIAAITLAGFSAHPPGMSGYAHEVHVEGWSLLRVGAVLGAAYLARRLQRGRRPRREPPWRRVPPAGR